MSEADGVESGAICKRGFTHLQFADKPETPEAERHLEREFQSRVPVSSWVPKCSNLLAVGPGSIAQSKEKAICQKGEASTNYGSRDQLLKIIELFSKVPQNSSKMTLSHILI
uniref:Uncharacterized protein n=1 Tax=Vespula pensylvanica TaxID=30213 RepID=A0A834NBG5_VESPE|nr:hypothetical protein H0235_015355 [Vespula pensylvanica]